MSGETRNENLTRVKIMSMLSDDEVASVSTASRLEDGAEYIDLQHLEAGVQQAFGPTPTGSALPRKAVTESTWHKLVTRLATTHGSGALAPEAPDGEHPDPATR